MKAPDLSATDLAVLEDMAGEMLRNDEQHRSVDHVGHNWSLDSARYLFDRQARGQWLAVPVAIVEADDGRAVTIGYSHTPSAAW